MRKPKIGLLPLYIELYDQAFPEMRPRIEAFRTQVAEALEKRGVETVTYSICRVAAEFKEALKTFEEARVDALVSLHLAYSPSLESADLLAATPIPLVVLDTTPAYSFPPHQAPDELLYNHGIHGVQDLCNLLLRRGKKFDIEAGHWEKSDVLDRVVSFARACCLASRMRNSRVGRIGRPFVGMGDFAVSPEQLQAAGITTLVAQPAMLARLVNQVDPEAIEREIQMDRETFIIDGIDENAHLAATRTSLAVRKWLDENELTAFTFNFMEIDQQSGIPTVPFLEASKAMAKGVGYAGEGDVLTASVVGAIASLFPDTTFTEMFCPDWENQTIFLSHMGEMNPRVTAAKPQLKTKAFPFTDACPPVAPVGCLRGGEAVLVNLSPQADQTFALIVSPVTMIDVTGEDAFQDAVRGWFRPRIPIEEFLEEYSRNGGTHHLALVYGNVTREITRWGKLMGWKTVVIE
ncbi:MAG TPA: hypothetical protein PLP42_10135 [Acidobacteriota bacterium]|nr:hypothetical protein [Acidobacteriota bacterium]